MQWISAYLKHVFQIYSKSFTAPEGCVYRLGLDHYFTIYLHPELIAANTPEWIAEVSFSLWFGGPLGSAPFDLNWAKECKSVTV